MEDADSSTGLNRRLASLLAYAGWWMTGLIVWFIERRDPVIRFHAAQAVVAFGLLALLIALLSALALVSLSFMPAAFDLLVLTAQLVTVIAMILWVVTMWLVATGRSWRIPLAGRWAERLSRM